MDDDAPHVLRHRDFELDSSDSRYNNIVAGGSDAQRRRQWIIYSSVALIVAAFVLVVMVSILRKPLVCKRPFNLFLIFLMIPDFVFSFFCGINCAINAAKGDYVSEGWCHFQVFYCVWGIGANAWLNGAIAQHVHTMLLCCKRRQRYFPPSRSRVVTESLLIYAWLAFIALWTFIPVLPHKARLSAGLACLPHEYDTASTVFQWVVFVPLFALLPTAYAMYVAFDVVRRKLLPPEGKKRDLAIYFFRLVVAFLVMWLPSIFLMFVAGGHLPAWVSFIGGVWSHLQGAVSAIASTMKQDIYEAFLEFVTCGQGYGVSMAARFPSGSASLNISFKLEADQRGRDESSTESKKEPGENAENFSTISTDGDGDAEKGGAVQQQSKSRSFGVKVSQECPVVDDKYCNS